MGKLTAVLVCVLVVSTHAHRPLQSANNSNSNGLLPPTTTTTGADTAASPPLSVVDLIAQARQLAHHTHFHSQGPAKHNITTLATPTDPHHRHQPNNNTVRSELVVHTAASFLEVFATVQGPGDSPLGVAAARVNDIGAQLELSARALQGQVLAVEEELGMQVAAHVAAKLSAELQTRIIPLIIIFVLFVVVPEFFCPPIVDGIMVALEPALVYFVFPPLTRLLAEKGGPLIADSLVKGMGLGLVFFVGLAMPFTLGKTLSDSLFGIMGVDTARAVVVSFQDYTYLHRLWGFGSPLGDAPAPPKSSPQYCDNECQACLPSCIELELGPSKVKDGQIVADPETEREKGECVRRCSSKSGRDKVNEQLDAAKNA